MCVHLAPQCPSYHRTDRVKKLKEARDTAGKDIAAYQATKEAEFRAFEASVRLHTLAAGNVVANLITARWDNIDYAGRA